MQEQKKPAYESIIYSDGFKYFGNDIYTKLTVFLNNNTNDTLYYQGTDCPTLNFELKRNPYFHLAPYACDNTTYSKKILPPHHSQKMEVYLMMDEDPDKDVPLILNLNLYRWEGDKINWQKKDKLNGKLTDTIILHNNTERRPYWPKENFELLKRKEKRILPSVDTILLSDSDKSLYTLSVDEKEIDKARDTVIKNYKKNKLDTMKYISVTVSLYNNSNQMLKFYTMTCSWFEFWGTDSQGIGQLGWDCDSNFRKR